MILPETQIALLLQNADNTTGVGGGWGFERSRVDTMITKWEFGNSRGIALR